jgi:hypothetical protein
MVFKVSLAATYHYDSVVKLVGCEVLQTVRNLETDSLCVLARRLYFVD